MRPVKLTMQAFGSYGKKTDVDFTRPGQNIFLITGDTGAGKSTLFDAIVFALFGEASSSRNRKDGTELQSQFAGREVEPFVELSFTEEQGGETVCFTVRRCPRHIRPLKKGSGTKEEGESLSLLLPDGTELTQKQAQKRLLEIVGLDKSQFMQVAMIAQGEFMDMLRASSNDKKLIFRKLFNTGIYQDIVDELARRRQEKLTEMGQIRTLCQAEISHIVLPEGCAEGSRVETLKQEILRSDRLSVTMLEELTAALQQLCTDLDVQIAAAAEQRESASQAYLAAFSAATAATALLSQFAALEQSERELAVCREREPEMKQASRLIGQITAAYELRDVYDRFRDAQKQLTDAENALLEQITGQGALRKQWQCAVEAEGEAASARDQAIAACSQLSGRVEAARQVFSDLARCEQNISRLTAKAADAAYQAERAGLALTEQEQRTEQQRQRTRVLSVLPAQQERWQAKQAEALALRDDINSARKLAREAADQRKAAKAAADSYREACDAYEKKNTAFEAYRRAFLNAQAGLLAREQLHPGQPCPVCGSLEHPAPCVLQEDHRDLNRQTMDALGEEAALLRREQETASAEARSAFDLAEEKAAGAESARCRLQQRMAKSIHAPEDITVDEARSALSEWTQALEQEKIRLNAGLAELEELQQALAGAEETRSALSLAREQAQRAEADARSALSAAEATRQTLLSGREFDSLEAAEQMLRSQLAAKSQLDEAYNRAADVQKTAKTKLDNALALIDRYTKEIPELKQQKSQRMQAYRAAMEQRDMDEQLWQELVSGHTRQEPISLQEQLDAYNQACTAAQSRREAAVSAIDGAEKPVMETLTAQQEQCKDLLAQADHQLQQLTEAAKNDGRVHRFLCEKLQQRGEVMTQHKRLDDLYSLLAGKVTGSRMDIETYVQRCYLEQILFAANRRFRDMTAGQFELRMCDIDRAGEGRNRGLDLMVYSTVTGSEREVRTLSGGESFMAALSLALGMADQIQASSTAIHLDMMFIDEGFGSLDDRSRAQAVSVLKRMAGDSRLIGIISHVTELKQELDDLLIVSKDDTGSSIHWQIS